MNELEKPIRVSEVEFGPTHKNVNPVQFGDVIFKVGELSLVSKKVETYKDYIMGTYTVKTWTPQDQKGEGCE